MSEYTNYYEVHITYHAAKHARETEEAACNIVGWKYSKIDGDPVVGKGIHHYATMHYKGGLSVTLVSGAMHAIAGSLTDMGMIVTRKKIERVIYDTRSTRVRPIASEGMEQVGQAPVNESDLRATTDDQIASAKVPQRSVE